MLKKMFERLGIGGLSVETILDRQEACPGETITGHVTITGGSSDWECEELLLELQTSCLVEMKDGNRSPTMLGMTAAVVRPGRIKAGSSRSLSFVINVPLETPISAGSTRSAIATQLGVAMAVDPTDLDPVVIHPTPEMAAVLDAVGRQGFRLREVETEHNPRRALPITQEFDFRPTGHRRGYIEEVEISFTPRAASLGVTLTVDRRAGLIRAGGERKASFTLRKGQIGAASIDRELANAIDQLAR